MTRSFGTPITPARSLHCIESRARRRARRIDAAGKPPDDRLAARKRDVVRLLGGLDLDIHYFGDNRVAAQRRRRERFAAIGINDGRALVGAGASISQVGNTRVCAPMHAAAPSVSAQTTRQVDTTMVGSLPAIIRVMVIAPSLLAYSPSVRAIRPISGRIARRALLDVFGCGSDCRPLKRSASTRAKPARVPRSTDKCLQPIDAVVRGRLPAPSPSRRRTSWRSCCARANC